MHVSLSRIRFIAPEINPLPFFSPLIFSPLPDMLLLFVLLFEMSSFYFHPFALLRFDACCDYFFFLSSTPWTL